MQLLKNASALALFGLFATAAMAGASIDKLTLNPASGAKAGDKVTATVEISGAEGICGMEIEFGDGTREVFKVKPDSKLPLVFEHTFKAAGDFKVRAAGDKVENAFGCNGKQIVMYKVDAAAAAKAPAASGSPCPADWALKGKAGKDGSFTCVPKKGVKNAKKPEQPLDCPTGTSYFTKGKALGCEKG